MVIDHLLEYGIVSARKVRTAMLQQYKNPPIKEAVIEFQFNHSEKLLDAHVFGSIRDALSTLLPVTDDIRRNEITVQGGTDVISLERTVKGFKQISSDDHLYRVQVDVPRISIHRLAPYSSWEHLSPIVHLVLDALGGHVEMNCLKRVGIRYINELHEVRVGTSKIFNTTTVFPPIGGSMCTSFSNTLFAMPGLEGNYLRIQIGQSHAENTGATSTLPPLLDLDYYNDTPRLTNSDALKAWIEESHRQLELAFESLILDEIKQYFKPLL